MDKTLLIRMALRGKRAVIAGMKGASGSLGDLRSQADRASAAAGRTTAYKKLRMAVGRIGVQAESTGQAQVRAARRGRRAWTALTACFRSSNRELKEAERNTRRVTRSQKRLEEQARKTKRIMNAKAGAKAGRDMRRSAAGQIPGLIGASLPLAGAGKMAIDLESKMADVRKVVDFTKYQGGIGAFQSMLVDLSATRIPLKPKELADIAAAGGRLGIVAGKLKPFIVTTSKMAVAWDMAAEEAGDASAKLSNILKIPIEKTELLGDAINHLSDNTASKAPELINFMKRSAAAGKTFGLLPTQTLALGNAMLALGKPPEIAARGINYMLGALQNAPNKGKKFQAALGELGLDAQGLKDAIETDAQGALTDFLKRVATLKKGDQIGVLSGLFGTEWSDDLITLIGGMDEYRKSLRLVANEAGYAGSMNREFLNRAATTANKLTMTMNKLGREVLGFGGGLLPTINAGIDKVDGLLNRLAQVRQRFPAITSAAQKFVAALLAGVVAWKALKIGGKFIGGSLKEMWNVGRGLGARLGLGKKGRKGKAAGGLGSLAGAGATPVFVTNWPGGGFDLGGGRRRRGRTSGRTANRRIGTRRIARQSLSPKSAGVFARLWGGAKGLLSKGLGKIGLKGLGKSALKKVPLLGAGAGLFFAAQRALAGDWAGAAGELASGAVGSIPGIGTAASVALDAGLAARDMARENAKLKQADHGIAGSEQLARRIDKAGVPAGAMALTYSPTINAPGGDAKNIKVMLDRDKNELKKLIFEWLAEYNRQQLRVSMGDA